MRSNVNQFKMGVALSYLSRVIQIIIGLIYTPIMIRLLGQSEYGLYNIAASTIAYLGILNFGFGSAYMRFYSKYSVNNDKSKISVLNGMFFTIFSILGLVAVIAGIIIASNLSFVFGPSLTTSELGKARMLILILVVNLAISFPSIIFNTYLQANEKFVFQNTILIIRQITTPLIVLPILLAGYGSVGMVVGTVIINICIELVIVFYCFEKMSMVFSFKNFDSMLMREMIVYSSYIFINMIVDQVNNNVDKTILGRYSGTISVAIYSLGANLRIYFQQISLTISTVFTPRVHRMIASKASDDELTKLLTRLGRIQFILLSLVFSGFLFFGRPFISFWAGSGYQNVYPIALILMGVGIIPLIQNLGIEIQRAKNKHKFRSWLYLAIAIVNIMVSIPLAIRYGEVGVTLGTALAGFVGNIIIMNWYYHVKLNLNMIYFWSEILRLTPTYIIPSVYGIIVTKFVDLYDISNFLIYMVIYIVLFALSMFNLGLNAYEKGLLKKPFY